MQLYRPNAVDTGKTVEEGRVSPITLIGVKGDTPRLCWRLH
jgi:hypothetical protein